MLVRAVVKSLCLPLIWDVGGRDGRFRDLAARFEYAVLDLAPRTDLGIQGDICDCPQVKDPSHDIVYSRSLFEHVKEPWRAAASIERILKPGTFQRWRGIAGALMTPATQRARAHDTRFATATKDLPMR